MGKKLPGRGKFVDGSRTNTERRDRNKKELQDILNRISLELPGKGELWTPKIEKQQQPAESQELLTPYEFSDLPISDKTLSSLRKVKLSHLTRIQRATIPHALASRDILGEAPTGSGKTLAFVIPAVELLWRERWSTDDGVGALILAPTRELSQQIFDVVSKFDQHDFGAMVCYGGKNIRKEQSLIGNASILVGTPGRIKEHLESTSGLQIDNLQVLVLDEADKLVEFGFLPDLEAILGSLPPVDSRQNLLFSATLSASVRQLARNFCRKELTEHISVCSDGVVQTPKKLKQVYCFVELEDKLNVLFSFLCKNFRLKIIVFVSTTKQCRFIYEAFKAFKTGARLLEAHGGQDMGKRLNTYDEFAARKSAITLICTDLIGRGIDFPSVDWVVQLDAPPDVESYVHRIGRTARGTQSVGHSVLFLLPSEVEFVKRLKERNIEIKQAEIKPNAASSVTGRLAALCAREHDIRHLAVRAFQTYLKSLTLISDRQVVRMNKVLKHADAFAQNLGLAETPSLEGLQRTGESDANQAPLGGVRPDEGLKAKKNLSKVDRLKEKIASRSALTSDLADDDEEKKSNLSRRERRQMKIMEMRAKVKQQLQEVSPSGITVTVSKPSMTDPELLVQSEERDRQQLEAPEEEDDWRNNPSVQKALKRQRLVIRADGTAKLKGAAKLVPTHHKFFGSDDEAHDASTFAGVLASMKDPKDPQDPEERSSDDEELKGLSIRERFIRKAQKRAELSKQEIKLRERELKRELKRGRTVARRTEDDREAADLAKDDMREEGSPNKRLRVDESIADLEAAALAKIQALG